MRACKRVSAAIGGVHMLGPLWIVIHDDGLTIAWRQTVKFDWPHRALSKGSDDAPPL